MSLSLLAGVSSVSRIRTRVQGRIWLEIAEALYFDACAANSLFVVNTPMIAVSRIATNILTNTSVGLLGALAYASSPGGQTVTLPAKIVLAPGLAEIVGARGVTGVRACVQSGRHATGRQRKYQSHKNQQFKFLN